MSPVRRTSCSSSAISDSSRLRSRISGWLAAVLDHSAGSASLVSICASSLRMRAGSKILPQVAHLVAHGSIGEFEILKGCHDLLLRPDLFLNFGGGCGGLLRPVDAPQHDAYRKYGTQPRKHVAPGAIEGDIAAKTVLGGERVGLVAGDPPAHETVAIDGRGHAII